MVTTEHQPPSANKPQSLNDFRERPRPRRSEIIDYLLAAAFVGDSLAIVSGLLLGFWVRFRSDFIRFGVELPEQYRLQSYAMLIAIGELFLLITFIYLRLYDARNLLRFRRVNLIIFRGVLFWFFSYLGVSLALKFTPPISRIYVAVSCLSTLFALFLWRWVFHQVIRREPFAGHLRQRVLFVGWSSEAASLSHAIAADAGHPYEIVGYIPASAEASESGAPPEVPLLGRFSDLKGLLRDGKTDILVLADPGVEISRVVSLSSLCERHFVRFKVIPGYFQILASCLHLETISGVPIMGNSELALDWPFNRVLKRSVDILGSILGLVLSLPIVLICAIMVFVESPGPTLFSQERIGRNGRRFRMYKIRSMRIGADSVDHLSQSTSRHDPRLLRIGAFMRRWNLDELPQFWNVLKGDMSLVGPRPERTFHSEKLSEEIPHYNARYSTKPGMTGWAQVNGLRGDTSLTERIRYDLFYLENWSLFLDLQIIAQTFFTRRNAY